MLTPAAHKSWAENIDLFNTLNFDVRAQNLLDQPCFICKSTDSVEMHQLRQLKDTKDKGTLIKFMSKIRRKVIPLCQMCQPVHSGKSDGLSLIEKKRSNLWKK